MSKREMYTELTKVYISYLYNFINPFPSIDQVSFKLLEERQEKAIKQYQNDSKFHAQVQNLISNSMFVIDKHMNNNYKRSDELHDDYLKAVDIIEKNKVLREAIIIEIAKIDPGIIIEGYNALQNGGWKTEVIPLLNAGKKIGAIKRCRELTGMSVKEAVEACKGIGNIKNEF